MCLVYLIETEARDLLLELVPFIFLRQQLHETECRSLSLCDCCLEGWGCSSESEGLKVKPYIEDDRNPAIELLEKG